MGVDYRLRLGDVLVPFYGNCMYRNRTVDNSEFMANADDSVKRKAGRREKITLATSCIAVPVGIGMILSGLVH